MAEQTVEVDMVGITFKCDRPLTIVPEDGHQEKYSFYRVKGLTKGSPFELHVSSLASTLTPNGMGVCIDFEGDKNSFHLTQSGKKDDLFGAVFSDEARMAIHVWPCAKNEKLVPPSRETDTDRVLVFIFDIG